MLWDNKIIIIISLYSINHRILIEITKKKIEKINIMEELKNNGRKNK